MCGLAGFTGAMGADEAGRLISAMTGALAHRGPDGSGVWTTPAGHRDRILALGHRRLAILDLSDAALQPFHGTEGTQGAGLTVIFNGEIYNYLELRDELITEGHSFRTRSDTEVLLTAYAAWGEACFSRLRGMYALALWDARRSALVLARDPFGKKPLLYFRHGDGLVFASELAGLSRHPGFHPEIDETALARYLLYKYVPGTKTLLSGVNELPPGHFATWTKGRLDIRRHYRPPAHERDRERLLPWTDDTVQAFRRELSEAVRLRMRSDAPLGAFLSGGLDSSSIVALMAEHSASPVRTFSIGFREEGFSELWAARMVAKRFGTDHHELEISPEDFLDQIDSVTARRGAPLSEMADIPVYMLSKLAGGHVKVVLSGEGSDELLAGYPKHWGDLAVNRMHRLLPRGLEAAAMSWPAALLGYRGRRLQVLLRAGLERDFLDRQAAWFGLMNRRAARRLCPGLEALDRPFEWAEDPGEDADPLHRALMFDKTVWLPSTLLERGDRMTMAASIEGRMPFMDTELCAFVSRLPPEAFLAGRTGKNILRRAMNETLPPEILHRPKSGFRVPVHEWLRGRLRNYLHDMLLSPTAELAPYIDHSVLAGLIADHRSRRVNREKELWSLLALEVFLRGIRRPEAGPADVTALTVTRASESESARAPAISIVLPTCNRTEMLAALMETLADQIAALEVRTQTTAIVQLVVADNDPAAGAGEVCDRFARRTRALTYVHVRAPGVVHARNAGVAAATGTHVVFLDDDEFPDPDWLTSWYEQARRGVAASFGPVRPEYQREPGANSDILNRMFSRSFDLPTGTDITAQLARLGTGNSMFRRSLLDGAFTFDSRYNGTGGEDLHLIGRLVRQGHRLTWNAEAGVAEFVTAERMTVRYLKERRFNQAQLRCLLTRRRGGALMLPRLGLWMAVGAAQVVLNGGRYMLSGQTRGARRQFYEIQLQGGLGKLFWYRGRRASLYAAGS